MDSASTSKNVCCCFEYLVCFVGPRLKPTTHHFALCRHLMTHQTFQKILLFSISISLDKQLETLLRLLCFNLGGSAVKSIKHHLVRYRITSHYSGFFKTLQQPKQSPTPACQSLLSAVQCKGQFGLHASGTPLLWLSRACKTPTIERGWSRHLR